VCRPLRRPRGLAGSIRNGSRDHGDLHPQRKARNGRAPARSLWQRQRWLILRRSSQVLILLAFLTGPWFGLWIAKGNLSSSLTLGVLPLTDPLLVLQTLLAGHVPYSAALIGAAIVLGFYLLVGGRVFCSWVCPVNVVTDAAAWSRRRLGIKTGRVPDAATRYWLLGGLLVAAALTGTLVWEWVNPVSLLHRALIFGMGGGLFVIAGIFLRPAGGQPRLVRPPVPGGRLLRPARQDGAGPRVAAAQPQGLRRLHGLLCRVPRAPGDPPRPQAGGADPPPDPGRRLHHLRPLHRRVRQTGFQNDS
jgi:hypothetical protein